MSSLRRYLIFGSILLIIYFVAQYFKPKPTDWSTSYLSTDKIPFGTYILRQHIHEIFPGVKVSVGDRAVYNNLKSVPQEPSNYLMFASTLKLDSLDFAEMVKYMERGNHIFIAAERIHGVLASRLKLEVTSDFDFRNRRKYPINFVNPQLRREYDYYFDKGISEQYFSSFDSTRAIVLGKKQELNVNFVKYQFGKGALIILPNPALLSNYSLLREDGLDYASKALSHLPPVKNLIWDEHALANIGQKKSVLRVFFEYEQLRWAYYIALIGLVFFVLFEMKRRQRIIPVMEALTNTSVEFVKVVGRVYYQQRNNRDIAEKKVQYLLAAIRNNYRLKTSSLDEAFQVALLKITAADPQLIAELLNAIRALQEGGEVADQQLIHLNKLIEQFNKLDQ